MSWVDWGLGFCYGLGIGSIVVGWPLARVASIKDKTIKIKDETLRLQQKIIAAWEEKCGGTSEVGSEVGTVRPDQPV